MSAPLLVELSVPIGYGLEPRELLELAVAADNAGLDGVVVAELASTEAFALLGAIAAATRSVRLETSVVSVLSRSPSLLAMASATLAGLSDGRFVLGLGAGSPIVGAFHARDFERPLTQVARCVQDVRTVLTGGSLDAYGRFSIRGMPLAPVPIFLSAMNKHMVALAGRIGDGLVLNLAGPDQAHELSTVAREARLAAGVTAPLEVHAIVWLYAGEHLDAARARFRLEMAPYLAVPTYRQAAIALSDEDAVNRAAEAWRRGGREAGAASFPDTIVEQLLIPASDAAQLAATFTRAGATGVRFVPMLDDTNQIASAHAAIDALAELTA